jgi:hypothetical protein
MTTTTTTAPDDYVIVFNSMSGEKIAEVTLTAREFHVIESQASIDGLTLEQQVIKILLGADFDVNEHLSSTTPQDTDDSETTAG